MCVVCMCEEVLCALCVCVTSYDAVPGPSVFQHAYVTHHFPGCRTCRLATWLRMSALPSSKRSS